MVIPLSNIEPGTKAEVVWIASPPPMAARLDGLGFSPREIDAICWENAWKFFQRTL